MEVEKDMGFTLKKNTAWGKWSSCSFIEDLIIKYLSYAKLSARAGNMLRPISALKDHFLPSQSSVGDRYVRDHYNGTIYLVGMEGSIPHPNLRLS